MISSSELKESGRRRSEGMMRRVDSYTVRKNQRRPELRKQFELSREEFLKTVPNHHPIATCEEIDNAMRGWLNLKRYKWLNATVEDGVFYPRIAVDAFAKPKQG